MFESLIGCWRSQINHKISPNIQPHSKWLISNFEIGRGDYVRVFNPIMTLNVLKSHIAVQTHKNILAQQSKKKYFSRFCQTGWYKNSIKHTLLKIQQSRKYHDIAIINNYTIKLWLLRLKFGVVKVNWVANSHTIHPIINYSHFAFT